MTTQGRQAATTGYSYGRRLAALLLVLALAGLIWGLLALRPAVAPGSTPGQTGRQPGAAQYVGGKQCAACHAAQYEAWRGSHHDLAMQEPGADNVLAAGTADGKIIVPAPMDYIPWVKPVDDFAHRADLAGSQRSVLVSGTVTPLAKQELTALGWQVTDNFFQAR